MQDGQGLLCCFAFFPTRKGQANTLVHAQTQGGAPASGNPQLTGLHRPALCLQVFPCGRSAAPEGHSSIPIHLNSPRDWHKVQKLVTTESGFLKLSTTDIWARPFLVVGAVLPLQAVQQPPWSLPTRCDASCTPNGCDNQRRIQTFRLVGNTTHAYEKEWPLECLKLWMHQYCL